jgi:predicted TIM-barrel fold metal-dependent hydrolase
VVSVWPPAVEITVDFLGPERVMYGSDYPFWDPDRGTEALEQCGFDAETRRAIEHGTADAVFGLGADLVAQG